MALWGEDEGMGEALREAGESDYVDDKLQKLSAKPGVRAVILMNDHGVPIRTYFDESYQAHTYEYISVVNQLLEKVNAALRQLDKAEPDSWGEGSDCMCFRVRSKKNEIIVAPGDAYTIVIVQDLNAID
eukprot:TRINITY_DN13330_c0_g2_i1.p1 TRINITY_DN13330_c0_g2~~TRINITY_DN13330_c0_g2_i1.p1  ORF type:complete len:129 (+),score=52.63 TRINITY_DN13330_c0_g2_i1:59-445(+)